MPNQIRYTPAQARKICRTQFHLSIGAANFVADKQQQLIDELAKGDGYVYDDGLPGLGMGWEADYNALAVAMGHKVESPNEVDETWPDVDAVFDTFFRE